MVIKSAYITATTSPQDVVVNGPGDGITVTNLDGGGVISFRVDGIAAGAAAENHTVGAAAGAFKDVLVGKFPVTVSVYASADTITAVDAFS